MKNTFPKQLIERNSYRCPQPKQDGVVLFIALIVLVAMSLAGVGMMRSVEAGNKVAGNLAFRQAAIHSAEAAFEQAISQLGTMASSGTGRTSDAAFGFSTDYQNERHDEKNWSGAWQLGTDYATGNDVAMFIERMCTLGSCQRMNYRSSATPGQTRTGPPLKIPREQYRVLARVTSPQGLITYIEEKIY